MLIINGEDDDKKNLVKYVDERLLATPPIALTQATKEVLRLGNIVTNQFDTAEQAFLTGEESFVHRVFDIEKTVNSLTRAIIEFLLKLDKESLTDFEKDKLITLLNTINDIERVGDHADNIAELVLYKIENEIAFSEDGIVEVKEMFEYTKDAYKMSLQSLATIDCDDCYKVFTIDKEIDRMYKLLRKNHIERLNDRECEPNSGVVFLDTISNLERIGDHSTNIAESVLEVVNKIKIINVDTEE
jgi:phosphate:Na+ symporter